MIISVSDFFINNYFYMIVGLVGGVIGLNVWKKTKTGMYKFD